MDIKPSHTVLLFRDEHGFIESLKNNLQVENIDIVNGKYHLHIFFFNNFHYSFLLGDIKLHTLLSSYYDRIVTFNPNNQEAYFEYLRILKPNGVLYLLDSAENRDFKTSSDLNSKLIVSGFTNISVTDYSGYILVCLL